MDLLLDVSRYCWRAAENDSGVGFLLVWRWPPKVTWGVERGLLQRGLVAFCQAENPTALSSSEEAKDALYYLRAMDQSRLVALVLVPPRQTAQSPAGPPAPAKASLFQPESSLAPMPPHGGANSQSPSAC